MVYNVSELADVEDGTTLSAVTGRLVSLFPAKSGESKYGQWTLQSGYLADLDDGDEKVKIVFSYEVDDDLRGNVVTIKSVKGKHGLAGAKIDTHEWRNNEGEKCDERQIKVSKSAKVLVGGETDDHLDDGEPELPMDDEEEQPRVKARPIKKAAPKKAPKPEDEIPGAESPGALVKKAADRVEQLRQLYMICMRATTATAAWVPTAFTDDDGNDLRMTKEQEQAMTSTLFIAADKLGLSRDLPSEAVEYLQGGKKSKKSKQEAEESEE